MRKIFTDRMRLVVYLEAQDLDRLTAKARSEGRTLVEWARERLLESLNGKAVRREEPVRVARRRASAHERAVELVHEAAVAENPESSSIEASEEDVIVARRSGHTVGCQCVFVCARLRKMVGGKL